MPIHDHLTDVPGVVPGLRYAHAVTVSGRLAFVSGQVATDVDGNLVGPGDLATQTRQALHNLQRVLDALGADWSYVVRFTWYVLDAAQVQVIRDVRDEVLALRDDQPRPASTLIQVAGLFRPGFLMEVDAIVALPD
ncbi:RidA family protein [Actinopolymorpha alba]|uniref:RidA family protein n=1 Tax=Actinopolymorpha alba TaxID=533267 RepID=UPI00036BA6D2|nr:RidA family protein [Actinopolymorpha alba]